MKKVVCPYCERELSFEDICWSPIDKKDHKKIVYYCSNCRKILGFTTE
ncbi:MAG: hypothetical protein ACTSXO_02135 [Candidatus Heimdallarchaeota archaeon]